MCFFMELMGIHGISLYFLLAKFPITIKVYVLITTAFMGLETNKHNCGPHIVLGL